MNIAEGIASMTAAKFVSDGVAVVYSRGETEIELTAVLGRTRWEGEGAEDVTVTMESPDWFVQAADLGDTAPPAAGDLITAGGKVYAVCAPGADEHVYQWADGPNRTVYRVHTKQVGEE